MSIAAIFGATTPNLPALRGYAPIYLWLNTGPPGASRFCILAKPGRLPLAWKPARHGNPELRQLVQRAHELTKLGVGGP